MHIGGSGVSCIESEGSRNGVCMYIMYVCMYVRGLEWCIESEGSGNGLCMYYALKVRGPEMVYVCIMLRGLEMVYCALKVRGPKWCMYVCTMH